MRTTLIIADALFRELKKRAAAERRTLSEVTQEALRRGLAEPPRRRRAIRVRIRAYSMGRPGVDLADRARLLDVLGKP